MADGVVSIVVVDDDGDLRLLVRQALQLSGRYSVVGEAPDARTAIEVIADHEPDIVVLDLGLPDMAGHDLIPRIVEVAEDTRIVVFTGSEPDKEHLTRSRGADRFVVKGDIDRLLRVLDDLLRRSGARSSKRFPPVPESVSAARRFIDDHCRRWGCEDAVDAAALIVSELVTNAIVHAQSAAEMTLRFAAGVLGLRWSMSREARLTRGLDATSESGRGMFLIAAMSHAWGVEPTETGKVVWPELAAGAPSSGA